jgi:probable rRNA maturation factor
VEVDVQSTVSGAPRPAPVRRLLGRAERALGGRSRGVSVLFCGDRRMAGLNRHWRRKARSTDVLAFPANETVSSARAAAGGFLGDIVISVPYARRQAGRRGEPPAREMSRLLLHGYLHLLGYDHERDEGQMDALEAKLRRRLRIEESTRGEAGRRSR